MYPRSVAQQNGRTEAVPVEFAYVNPPIQANNNNDATSDFRVPIHRSNQVGIMPTMVEPGRQSSPGMAKTKLKSDSVETLVFVSHQGRGQLMQKEVFTSKGLNREVEVALMTGPGASAVAVLEKAKSRTEMASPSKLFTSKGLNREVEVALMTGPGASAAAVLEKAKSRTEMASPSKLAVGQTVGARKVESFPHGSTQEEKVKPKPEKVLTTKTFGGPRNAPRKDQSREAKEKGVDINTRVSNYITSAKIRIRTMSNAGGTKGAGKKDGGTDHFGNYIQRAKMKIRTMSGIGGDKNVQSK